MRLYTQLLTHNSCYIKGEHIKPRGVMVHSTGAMAARRHSSVAARMPLFRIFEMQCSRFKTEKLPSAQILRSRIMDRYSGVPTR